MGLVLLTPPAAEPLTVAEVQSHLRLDTSSVEPAPGAPVAALVAQAGIVDAGAHRYCVTFVTADGETQGGDVTDAVTTSSGSGQVALTSIPVGGALVIARRIYRTKAGQNAFFLLATLANNSTTTFTDNLADTALGTGLPATNTTGDPLLGALISAARQRVEAKLRRPLLTQTWRYTRDRFPASDQLRIPKPPLQAITAITYVDWTATPVVLDPATYEVDTVTLPGRIVLAWQKFWPLTLPKRNALTIDFQCGYGLTAASVPAPILAAMRLMIGDLYEHREAQFVTSAVVQNATVERLLEPYVFRDYALTAAEDC